MTPRAAFGVTPLGEGGTPLDRRSRIFGCPGLGALLAPEEGFVAGRFAYSGFCTAMKEV